MIHFAKKLDIKHFRGVFMRDELPKTGPWRYEAGVINLDDDDGPGTHWCAYRKAGNMVYYFDSFGNLQPPPEFIKYLGGGSHVIRYNHEVYQDFDSFNCGHLCLEFLSGTL